MAKRDPNTINKRERAILDYIEKQSQVNGYPPSVREIGKAVGLKSTATVHGYLAKLEEKGYIKKESQKGRTLKLLKGSSGKATTESRKDFYTGREMVDVPVIGKITAGAPILAVENITDTFPIPIDFVGNSESFMLTVRGESMIEAGILDGDYILVKKQNVANNGEIVVALIEDEATVKTFYKEKDYIRLQPENSTMDPIIVPDCKILGKVAGVFRKMKKRWTLMERIRDEIENENSTWRRSINTMLKHNDLEGLISIRDSEVLDDEVKKYLEEAINILGEKERNKQYQKM